LPRWCEGEVAGFTVADESVVHTQLSHSRFPMNGALVGHWLHCPVLLSYLVSFGVCERQREKARMELDWLKIKIEN